MHRLIAVPLVALALAGTADARPTPQDKLTRLLAGRTAGPETDCVNARNLRGPTVIDEGTLVYREGSTVYVNRPAPACGGLKADDTLVFRLPTTRICRGDIATIVDPPQPGSYGSCTMGAFTPYRR